MVSEAYTGTTGKLSVIVQSESPENELCMNNG